MLKLLIADATQCFRDALAEAVGNTYTVRCCADGEEALHEIRTFSPDLVVLDVTLPGVDGLQLAEYIRQTPGRTAVLATTRFISDYLMETASRLGVDYMIVKPCSVRSLVVRLEHMARFLSPVAKNENDLRAVTANLLMYLGIRTNRKGYTYLREAIPLYCRDPGQSMTKELYPQIAKLCNADALQVERTIRGAIEGAWQNREEHIWNRYFSQGAARMLKRPTNSEFISRLSDILLLELEEGPSGD